MRAQGRVLEGQDVARLDLFDRVPVHVQVARRHVLDGLEALVELLALLQLGHQFVGDLLTGLVVDRVQVEHLAFEGPVLDDLAGHLDEVPRDRRVRSTFR